MNKVILGNNKDILKTFEDNSIDSIVTDPPYELGFMGKRWDSTGIAYDIELWQECMRVLKPGGHLLAFSGTRTYHRMAVAIEDAGFEIRDMIEWVYGSGFPKSLNIGKAVDKLQGNERELIGEKPTLHHGTKENVQKYGFATEGNIKITKGTSEWEGWGTALKPAHEPICMARKPLSEKTVAENCLKWGTGGINVDESRIGTDGGTSRGEQGEREKDAKQGFRGNRIINELNTGRFPANLIHDGSDDVVDCFPDTKSGKMRAGVANNSHWSVNKFDNQETYGDSGNASRFFKSIIYQPKASKAERNKGCEGLPLVENSNGDKWSDIDRRDGKVPVLRYNNHPTVKPVELMAYLIKMVTPKGGIVLDPFAGSGSTLVAAKESGFQYVGIDITPEYIEIINARLSATSIQGNLFL